jgi:hypothetical protein
VATGFHDRRTLDDAGADVSFADLSEVDTVIAALLAVAASRGGPHQDGAAGRTLIRRDEG